MMEGNKILSALCYFSIFFAPFLFPIIVYFVTEQEVKEHAKKALWSHLIPLLVLFLGVIGFGFMGVNGWSHFGIAILIVCIVFGILALYYFIWNIIQGIKVLMN